MLIQFFVENCMILKNFSLGSHPIMAPAKEGKKPCKGKGNVLLFSLKVNYLFYSHSNIERSVPGR
jgi:hypothetical protein